MTITDEDLYGLTRTYELSDSDVLTIGEALYYAWHKWPLRREELQDLVQRTGIDFVE